MTAIDVLHLPSGYWHLRGVGPCNWAQPPHWPCDEATLRAAAFPQASEAFLAAALRLGARMEGAMPDPLDLDGIRTRHAADETMIRARDGRRAFADERAVAQMHADRGVLLAALDRLAAVSEDDILLAIKFCATDRAQAAAVLALVQARVAGS